ncbi:NADH-quinone oxidoreductase subunit NuoF [Myxococcota bacterium]|nr:NADH-quinone oxidoreductase subunit NuoF [Myxococcota bacterium]MBU1379603.1 NADH-quinone oxidoreductase subunit NuoF [Myxococcota bacterium]MBU1496300.1 NADH-quinone oxidoreductase subunit NuoF [Myxococcota bacterium]
MTKVSSVAALEQLIKEKSVNRTADKKYISVCGGTGCLAGGGNAVIDALSKELTNQNMDIEVVRTGCHGFCERGPLVVIHPEGTFYNRVKPADVPDILEKTIKNGEVIKKLLYRDENKVEYEKEKDVPFYKHQMRVVFENNGHIDPEKIEDYFARGGYKALAKVLGGISPDDVVDLVLKSGLRGRGGGGFPTGVKWKSCRKATGGPKYVLCNADEGDPGAFMDRSIMEGNPHSVIEGMLIGAYAIGSTEGYIYIRNEYPLAVHRVKVALEQAREYGLLGENILGTGFSFDIKINRGGGAFICGESTALMMSIEGKVGRPRPKYIHTVESGLWDKPTNLNNVETWANVPHIIEKGVEWYTSIGTGDVSNDPWGGSKGTKIFSLVGKVNNTGLVEVPMGITLRDIIYKIGGGIKNAKKGRTFKAIQTGGPSGGCIPEKFLDEPVDFDGLTKLGSMMGSGGMIVMDDMTCMVEVARYFVDFLKDESCGKCTPCREGLRQMSDILNRITKGEGRDNDIDTLYELGRVMEDSALCALGQTAAYPVLSTVKYFREEYEQHIKDGYCAGKQCTSLIRYTIDPEKCTGCSICAKKCPTKAISGELKKTYTIDQDTCVRCGVCFDVCNFNAVIIPSGSEIREKLGE